MVKSVLFIAVNYNSTKETIDLVKSLNKLYDLNKLQVVVVENSDHSKRDNKLIHYCKEFINDLLFAETPSNHSYFGSVNFALNALNLLPSNYDYFIISNVDIIIEDQNFLTKLFNFNNKNIGLLAPKIISTAQCVDQNPYMKKRFKKFLFYYYFIIRQHQFFTFIHETITNYLRLKTLKNNIENTLGFIYAPHGAFIIFTKEYFIRGASIDFGLNLFGEELFVAEECRKIDLQVYYNPFIAVLHTEHVSTGSVSSKFIVDKKRQSVKYFLKNF